MKVIQNIFQQNLSDAISNSGRTQSKIAELAGVTEPMISDYLKGKYTPRPITVVKLARALEVDPAWLGEGKKKSIFIGKQQPDLKSKILYFPKLYKIAGQINELGSNNPKYQEEYVEILNYLLALNIVGLERLKTLLRDLTELNRYITKDDIETEMLESLLGELQENK